MQAYLVCEIENEDCFVKHVAIPVEMHVFHISSI